MFRFVAVCLSRRGFGILGWYYLEISLFHVFICDDLAFRPRLDGFMQLLLGIFLCFFD